MIHPSSLRHIRGQKFSLMRRGGTPLYGSAVVDGTGPIWLTNLGCNGWETALFDCVHSPNGTDLCSHDSDVGVRCGNNL